MDVYQRALQLHEEKRGKLAIKSKVSLETAEDLSLAYTPGVAEPCRRIAQDKALCYRYTGKGNTIAVVTDGTAVLGLGDIGPEAALPVMEGKAVLFKQFGDVDAIPICLDTTEPDEIVRIVECIAPSFGGINLEDISAPRCFEIEERLKKRLRIPVFHDDQHGTAIVVAAALLGAFEVVRKDLLQAQIVVNGIGAAGTAIIRMLLSMGVENIIPCDKEGIVAPHHLAGEKTRREIIEKVNPRHVQGSLKDAMAGSDVFIGASAPGVVTTQMVETMASDAIIFALANPEPEIFPDAAKKGGARVVGTGRSDFPNQINNLLAFPGVFKGALEAGAEDITDEMKLAAAKAIAQLVKMDGLDEEHILPSPLDPRLPMMIADEVKKAWDRSAQKVRVKNS